MNKNNKMYLYISFLNLILPKTDNSHAKYQIQVKAKLLRSDNGRDYKTNEIENYLR